MFGTQNGDLTNAQKRDLLVSAMQTMAPADFTAAMAKASILPIARQMIEKSFARKTFQVDQIDGPVAIYQTKRRQVPVVMQKYGGAPTQIYQFPRLTVTPYYIMAKPEVELSDLMDAQFDAASDILADAGAELAVKEDSQFLTLFNFVAADAGSTATNSVPTVSAGPGGIGYKLSGNNYRVGSNNTAPDGGATGEPGHKDVMASQALLRQIGYDPDTILINPDGLGKLNAQKAFLFYMNWGTREVAETGYMRNMFGNRVIWSALVPQKSAYIFDTYEFARLVEREALTVRPEFQELRAKWLCYMRVAPFVRNANAVIRLTWYV